MKTNQKIGIQNRVLIYGAGLGILICGIGIESWILKSAIQKANQKIKFDNYISEATNQFQNFDFQILDWQTGYEIDTQNSDFVVEIQAPFFNLPDEERHTICCIVAGEAKGESMEGKMMVATCILNAMVKDGISASEVRTRYKYSGWDDDLENSNPDAWAEVCEAVSRVFDDGESVSENPILFFYAPKRTKGTWHRTLPCDQIIGNHSFHYLKQDIEANWFLELKNEKH